MTPQDKLHHARALHRALIRGSGGYWPRACALLARMALEEAVTARLSATQPGLADASMRSKLLCLHLFADEQTVHDAAAAWAGLSRAVHHHSYELAPTAAELAQWLNAVERVLAQATPAPA